MTQPIFATVRTVKLDKNMQFQIEDLREVVIVCDAEGNRLGHFMPLSVPTAMLDCLRACPYSEAELEEFGKQTGGRPLAEIMRSLEKSA
jgi:hypothetical protein